MHQERTMSKIVFEPLPPRTSGVKRRSRELAALAAALMGSPGEWARVGVYGTAEVSRSTATHIKKGRIAAFTPAGAFEAVARTVDGEHRVYARFVGTPAGGEQA
jgi:hypothetical protein